MADLVDNIKLWYEQKKFKELPKGPIGMHIEVKEPQWAKAVEQCIGEFLKFISDDFYKILIKYYLKALLCRLLFVIITKMKRYCSSSLRDIAQRYTLAKNRV
jgi:hypothetical protein